MIPSAARSTITDAIVIALYNFVKVLNGLIDHSIFYINFLGYHVPDQIKCRVNDFLLFGFIEISGSKVFRNACNMTAY